MSFDPVSRGLALAARASGRPRFLKWARGLTALRPPRKIAASPVTVTVATGGPASENVTAISGGIGWSPLPSAGNVRFFYQQDMRAGSTYPYSSCVLPYKGYLGQIASDYPWGMETMHYGRYFELVGVQRPGSSYRYIVDDELQSAQAVADTSRLGAFASYFTDFGTVALRKIAFMGYGFDLARIYTGPNDWIYPTKPSGPRVGILTDSFGAGSSGVGPLDTFVRPLMEQLGIEDYQTSLHGGTGLIAGGAQGGQSRLAPDILAHNPDIVINMLGRNDQAGSTSAQIQAASAACSAAVKADPDRGLIVTGPIYLGAPGSAWPAVQAAVFAGAAGLADVAVDTTTVPFTTAATGTVFAHADGIHLSSPAGQTMLVRRLAQDFAAAIRAAML